MRKFIKLILFLYTYIIDLYCRFEVCIKYFLTYMWSIARVDLDHAHGWLLYAVLCVLLCNFIC